MMSDESNSGILSRMERHTPENFNNFVPWLALQWQLPFLVEIIVKKQIQHSRLKFSYSSPVLTIKKEDYSEPTLFIKAFYNKHNELIEIEMIPSKFKIHRKLIHILNITLPYHPNCCKINLNRVKIDSMIVYEMEELLSMSNITEVSFDNTFVPECNYYILLERDTNLEYLSLSNCGINCVACELIASKLAVGCPAERKLKILNLSLNDIKNSGAKSLGLALRTNRTLLYLNLCGNKITDDGVMFILNSLIEFPLTYDEIIEKRKRYLKWIKSKRDVSIDSLAEIFRVKTASRIGKKKPLKKEAKKSSVLVQELSQNLSGEWEDVFSFKNTVIKNNYLYCLGNLTLCYLNMSYNNLEYFSVKKLYDVLKYQNLNFGFGLLNVVLDGNKIPIQCELYDLITVLLKTSCDTAMASSSIVFSRLFSR